MNRCCSAKTTDRLVTSDCVRENVLVTIEKKNVKMNMWKPNSAPNQTGSRFELVTSERGVARARRAPDSAQFSFTPTYGCTRSKIRAKTAARGH